MEGLCKIGIENLIKTVTRGHKDFVWFGIRPTSTGDDEAKVPLTKWPDMMVAQPYNAIQKQNPKYTPKDLIFCHCSKAELTNLLTE